MHLFDLAGESEGKGEGEDLKYSKRYGQQDYIRIEAALLVTDIGDDARAEKQGARPFSDVRPE